MAGDKRASGHVGMVAAADARLSNWNRVLRLLETGMGPFCEARFLLRFVRGREPFARTHELSRAVSAEQLLLPEGRVEREVVSDQRRMMLVRGPGWSMLLTERRGTGPVEVQITAQTSSLADELLSRVQALAPPPTPRNPAKAHVKFLTCNQDSERTYLHSRAIDAPSWEEIAQNYPTPVANQLERLIGMTELPVAHGRFVVLHGPPGTGKTTFLRALARAWREWCDVECLVNPTQFLEQPELLGQLAFSQGFGRDKTSRLILLEDVTAGTEPGERSRFDHLLSLTDGLLGQGVRLLIVMTTNVGPEQLHPALVRPGRCLARIELRPFDAREARNFVGRNHPPGTLAELLAARGDLEQITTAATNGHHTGHYL